MGLVFIVLAAIALLVAAIALVAARQRRLNEPTDFLEREKRRETRNAPQRKTEQRKKRFVVGRKEENAEAQNWRVLRTSSLYRIGYWAAFGIGVIVAIVLMPRGQADYAFVAMMAGTAALLVAINETVLSVTLQEDQFVYKSIWSGTVEIRYKDVTGVEEQKSGYYSGNRVVIDVGNEGIPLHIPIRIKNLGRLYEEIEKHGGWAMDMVALQREFCEPIEFLQREKEQSNAPQEEREQVEGQPVTHPDEAHAETPDRRVLRSSSSYRVGLWVLVGVCAALMVAVSGETARFDLWIAGLGALGMAIHEMTVSVTLKEDRFVYRSLLFGRHEVPYQSVVKMRKEASEQNRNAKFILQTDKGKEIHLPKRIEDLDLLFERITRALEESDRQG